jgi:L-lactate dehydrogenase complex protein LldG
LLLIALTATMRDINLLPVAVKSTFHKMIASVRAALEQAPAPALHQTAASSPLPAAPAARSAELISQFANELERVSGHFLGVMSPVQATEKIVALALDLRADTVAVGEGVTLDSVPIVQALTKAGIEPIRSGKVDDDQRRSLRAQLSRCDLAIAEAHYAIAATGTLAMVATPARPSSLTLLPPANLLLVDATRILPDMAAVIRALGPDTITRHRVAFITGPSRTADIEKMIVLGVHGPKHLYAAVLWPNQ